MRAPLVVFSVGLVGFACSSARIQQPTLLRVDPDALADSATVGSSTPRVMALDLVNEGGGLVHWTATVRHASPRLAVAPDTGTAGETPAPRVQIDPSGLAVGIYRDTLVIKGGSAIVRVPVSFRVY